MSSLSARLGPVDAERSLRRCRMCAGLMIASICAVHVSEHEVRHLWVCEDCGHGSVQRATGRAPSREAA